MIEVLVSALEKLSDEYWLRDFALRCDTHKPAIGKVMRKSVHQFQDPQWDGKKWSNPKVKLPGTCALLLSDDQAQLPRITKNAITYGGRYISIIRGDAVNIEGNDPGEIILANATPIAIWDTQTCELIAMDPEYV